MRLQVKGKNVEVSESIRSYAERKLGKLEKKLAAPTQVELELAIERNASIAANHVAEATIWTKGPTLRAREASSDMKASIDQVAEKLERQVIRYRDKRRRRAVRDDGGTPMESTPAKTDEAGQRIVKVKQFAVKPMSAEEAALQLELIGHDFFVFRNADSDEINVLYRRRDGGYGLIEPQ
jgi:putative sigma-54 modulation protein